IRDFHVTGVQTCALPISLRLYRQRQDACLIGRDEGVEIASGLRFQLRLLGQRDMRGLLEDLLLLRTERLRAEVLGVAQALLQGEIGRASCRERGEGWWAA